MQHYLARQRIIGGRWYYCCGPRPIGYCCEYIEIPVGEYGQTEESHAVDEANKHKHHTNGHATKEAACECYKQWLLDHALRFFGDSQNAQGSWRSTDGQYDED